MLKKHCKIHGSINMDYLLNLKIYIYGYNIFKKVYIGEYIFFEVCSVYTYIYMYSGIL